MAKPNLTEVYEALRVAEAEGRTDDVAKLIDYIESVQAAPDVAAEETFDPRELISSTVPAGAGAATGVVLPKVIESGVNQVKAGRTAAARPPAASVTVQGVPSSALADIEEATTKGLSNEVTQQTRTAQRAARTEQMEKILAELKAKGIPVNPKILAEMEAQYARPGSGILIPVERAREIAAQEAAAAKAAPKGSIGQRVVNQFVNPTISSDIGNFAKGVYDYKLPLVGSVGSLIGRGLVGAGAGIQGTDAYNRYKMGDTTGAIISGIGATGTAANLIPHPAAKAIGTGVGLSAEAINAYRDAIRKGRIEHGAPEDYERVDEMGNAYAQGGLVRLAGGGKPNSELPAWFPKITGYKAQDNSVDENLFEMGSNPELVTQDLKQNLAKNINLGDPNYLRGVNTIEADTPMGRGVVGQYAHINPHKISVRSNMGIPMDTARVLGHEAQHSQEADASKRNYRDSQNDTLLQYDRREAAGKGAFDLRKQIDENYKNYVKDYLAKQDAKSGNFGWAMDNGRTLGDYYIDPDIGPHYKSDERFADFAGLESILPRGQRLADTELGKAVFKTPEQASYYYQTVRPLEPKMLPQNPDNESEWIKARRRMADVAEQNKYKNRGVGSVFLDQIKAAMGKADGGQVQHFQVGGKAVSSGLDALRNLIKAEGRTPIVPMPNRWFTKPEDFPQMQGMVGKVLDKNQMGRDAFHSGAFVDPRTGQILDSNIYNNVGVLIDPFTGRPMMSAGDLSGIESLKDLGGKAGNQTLSNLVRKGLFKHTGGDKMLADTPFIATVEQGGMGHKYGLGTEYASPTEMYNTMRGNNPTLRPKSRGDVFGMGDVVGQVQIGGPSGLRHDVYENLFVAPKGSDVPGVKLNKAAGGLAHLAEGGQPNVNFSAQNMPNMTGRPGVGYMNTPPGVMARLQLEQELKNKARLRAGVTGIGMALPDQHGVKLMPGQIEAGFNMPVGPGNLDVSGFRSINPVNMPVQQSGHMFGGNARYTIPFAEGGDVKKPNADEGAAFIGYRPIQRQEKNRYGSGTGFLDALVGAPPSKENILDPRDLSYMQGYEKGEPYGIAAMALPFAGMAAKPLAKEIGTRAFMGESLAPKSMRQFMPEAQPAGIIKNEKGGNWAPEEILGYNGWTPENQMAETLGFHKNDPALENWVNTQLTRYVKNEMGTPGDPIRALADKGVLHYKPRPSRNAEGQKNNLYYDADKSREAAGIPEGESALTQLGKDWENSVDATVKTNIIDDKMIGEYGGKFPWLEKAKGQKLNSIDEEFMYSRLGFDHIADVLREQMAAGQLRPESLKSLSVPQAVQRVNDYNLAREKAMQKVQLQAQSEMPVAKEYPEQGYKWLQLKHPTDPKITEKALKYEGDAMGHCVGGYCPDVEAGSTKIYSLRDAKGEPHVTIEVKPGKHPIGYGVSGDENFPKSFRYEDSDMNDITLPKEQYDAIYNRAKEIFASKGNVRHVADARYDSFQQAANEVLGELPSKIQQIKGKQNAAVKDEYKPFVQDFVRSGKWEEVRDYQNAGLKNMDMTGSNYELTNVPEDIAKINHTERYHAVQEAIANKELPKYATEEEVADAIRKYARKHSEGGPVGYADGGSVVPALPANYQQARSAFDQQQTTNFPMGQMRATVVGNDQFGQQFGYAADADAFNTFYNQNYSGSTPVPQGGMPNIALPAMGVNPDGTTTPAPPQIWNERTGQYQSQTDTTPGAMPGPIGGLGGLLAGNNPTAPVGIVSPGMGQNPDGSWNYGASTPNVGMGPQNDFGYQSYVNSNPGNANPLPYAQWMTSGSPSTMPVPLPSPNMNYGNLPTNNTTPVNNIPVAPTPQANPIAQQVSNLPMSPNSPVAAATPSANVQNRPKYVPPPKTFNQFGTAINQVRQARPATPQVQPTRRGFAMSPLSNLRRR